MNHKEAQEYGQYFDALKNKFKSERTGEQMQYINQTELFKPLIETQNGIHGKIDSSQNKLSDVLIPFTNELRKKSEQVDQLQALPFHNVRQEIEDVPQSTPKQRFVFSYHLDRFLDDSDRINLVDISLRLPLVKS